MENSMEVTNKEFELIKAYRVHKDLQGAVDRLLALDGAVPSDKNKNLYFGVKTAADRMLVSDATLDVQCNLKTALELINDLFNHGFEWCEDAILEKGEKQDTFLSLYGSMYARLQAVLNYTNNAFVILDALSSDEYRLLDVRTRSSIAMAKELFGCFNNTEEKETEA